MLTVPDKIRGYMAERKISNLELSRRTGIDESALSKVLNNNRKFSIDEYLLIVNAFNEKPSKFLD